MDIKITSVTTTYERVVNLGNFENIRVGTRLTMHPDENHDVGTTTRGLMVMTRRQTHTEIARTAPEFPHDGEHAYPDAITHGGESLVIEQPEITNVGVTYERKFNTGNYESGKVGVTLFADLPDNETDAAEATLKLMQMARHQVMVEAGQFIDNVALRAQVQQLFLGLPVED